MRLLWRDSSRGGGLMTTGDRLTTPYPYEATAAQIVEGLDLSGRRVVVTGASSGIGLEMARTLAAAGAEVTATVRRDGQRAVDELRATTGAAVSWRALDIA